MEQITGKGLIELVWAVSENKRNHKELSEENKRNAKEQRLHFRGGYRSYAMIEQDLIKQYREEIWKNVTDIALFKMWKVARTKKENAPDIQKFFDDIDEMEKILPESLSQKTSRNNVLTEILGKPEHPGRVRGAGLGVSQKMLFRKEKHPSNSMKIVKLTQEVKHFKARVIKLENEKKGVAIPHSEMDSNDTCQIPEGVHDCELLKLVPHRHVVARGKMHKIVDDKVHHAKLGAGQLKVQIEDVMEGEYNTELPIQVHNVEPMFILREAIGSFVPLPTSLISLLRTSPSARESHVLPKVQSVAPVIWKKIHSNLKELSVSENQRQLAVFALQRYLSQGKSDVFDVRYPAVFWGKDFIDKLGRENIIEVVQHGLLSASSICFYIRLFNINIYNFSTS